VVLCTVHRIAPNNEQQGAPKYPKPFLDKGKFDGAAAPSGAK
jgi:hypothetical protein